MSRVSLQGLIESENARTMSREDLVSTFVPTRSFVRLLNPKNHVVIGARGSGKTVLAKMVSHDYLTGLADRGDHLASQVVRDQSFIGTYVSTKAEWVGMLQNKVWNNVREKEEYFSWRLNLSSCAALLTTFRSCIDQYIQDREQRLEAERATAVEVSGAWLNTAESRSFVDLRRRLEDLDYERQLQMTHERVAGRGSAGPPVGLGLASDLFAPLKRGIQLFKRIVRISERAKWILCLDEAEFLDLDHHRILNSHMRSDSEDLAFIVTTTPYRHLTLDTNTGAPLRVGHDFEYVYIDQERNEEENLAFAEALFRRFATRLGADSYELTLDRLLGRSDLLESKSSLWTLDSPEMNLLRAHATPELVQRAERLYKLNPIRFRNEIVRKVHGLLKLRQAVHEDRGNRNFEAYAGAAMVVRCGDGNPRRLLRIINTLLRASELLDAQGIESTQTGPLISPSIQSEHLIYFSSDALNRTFSESEDLHDFLTSVGEFMQAHYHGRRLTGDVYSAIQVDSAVSDDEWHLITAAVELGLLFPMVNHNQPDTLPVRSGRFHLANVLAPTFRLLPRRGKAITLRTLRRGSGRVKSPWRRTDSADQFSLDALWDHE